MRERMIGVAVACVLSAVGCGSSDEPSLHDPALLVGIWNTTASSMVAGSAPVQWIGYSEDHTYRTMPLPGARGTWNIDAKGHLVMNCTNGATEYGVFCRQTIVNFEVTSSELRWIWAGGTAWLFVRAPSAAPPP